MRHMPDGSYHYIAHYMDHWSKFHILWPLMKKSAVDVAVGLVKRVFPYLGLPKILQSDNGREGDRQRDCERSCSIMAGGGCYNQWASSSLAVTRVG